MPLYTHWAGCFGEPADLRGWHSRRAQAGVLRSADCREAELAHVRPAPLRAEQRDGYLERLHHLAPDSTSWQMRKGRESRRIRFYLRRIFSWYEAPGTCEMRETRPRQASTRPLRPGFMTSPEERNILTCICCLTGSVT